MFPRRILIVGLVALVILGLVLSGNAAQQREAWTQGFLVGRLSAGSSGSGSAAPLPPEVYPGLARGCMAHTATADMAGMADRTSAASAFCC